MLYPCYDKIVGLANTDCDCIATDRPEDYDVSKSGLYLDELSPISSILGAVSCGKTVWDMATTALSSATTQFVADTNALLGRDYRLKRKAVSKQVLGEIKHKDTVSPTKNYAVVTVDCCPVRSGVMKLRNLGGIFTQAGVVSVGLYDNVTGLLSTHELTTVANKHTELAVNLSLPLYSKYVEKLQYYLVYQFDPANPPKANRINCGCGGWVPSYNLDAPYYRNVGGHKRAPWADYVMVGGRQINSLTELDNEVTVMSNTVYGLTLEVDFSCKVDEVLCEDALDFSGNPLALSMALAIRYAAAILFKDAIFKTDSLNRESMVNRDEWEEDALVWQQKYNDLVNYIVSEADHTANDCLACKDILGLTRKGLFS